MKNKILQGVLVGCLVFALVFLSFGSGFAAGHFIPIGQPVNQISSSGGNQNGTPANLSSLFKPFWQAWNIVHQDYVDQPVNDTTLMQGAISGMLQSLGDTHTIYASPTDYKSFTTSMTGSYAGIGSLVDVSGQLLTISKPFPNSPAQKAGLQPGDQVIGVDGKDVTGMPPESVHQLVLGKEGTTVKLTIQRPGQTEPLNFTITRAVITIPSVTSKMLDNSIAYVQISTFGQNTAKDLHTQLTALLAQNPKALILDLRNNGGGYLETGVAVASEFISSGVIVTEKDGKGKLTPHNALSGGLATDKSLPMIVLVNAYTASASEIVAGALQDTGRAKLLGETTYGKGTAQFWIPLANNQGAVAVTIARWLTPNGRSIDKKGLTPDIVVKETVDDIKANRDPQLDAAVKQLTTP